MTRKPQSKPFLVLPLLEDELLERHSSTIFDMPMKNPGLHLFTRTWPANKNSKDSNENKRPLTATLEKPTILDIRLIGKIDMSKIRKEFLNISNLCRMPLLIKKAKHTKQRRPLSLPPTDIEKKRKKIVDTDDVSVTEEESTRSVKVTGKHASKLGKINRNKAVNACDTNNNHSKHLRTPRNNLISIPSNDTKSTKLPQPCNSCGRPDQPERLHSHPVTLSKVETSPKIQVKNTVQKPIAIKYKSKGKPPRSNESIPSPTRKFSLPTQNLVHSNSSSATEMSKLERGRNTYKKQVSNYRAASAKRTLTCYICGREYGTHSLHLHEPKCLEKWERENSLLPVQLQRKPPIKPPTDGKNREDWNNLAWEAAQANLVPCKNCHRTFYPDRLIVHLRSCKPRPKTVNTEEIEDPLLLANSVQAIAEIRANPLRSQPINGRIPQQNWQCYICKKKFSSQTIKEHEKICMSNWRKMNEANYPTGANAVIRHKVPEERQMVQSEGTNKDSPSPATPKTPPLFPCYLCGKLFSVNSIYIHEPQCLKKWKAENDKLPPNKRRQIPQKQEIKFTPSGDVDFYGTFNRIWDNHLAELVQCRRCKRKFFPNRIKAHEDRCAAAPIKPTSQKN